MKEKTLYVAPECDEIVVSLEGVIAASAEITNVSNPFDGLSEEVW